MIFRVNLGLTRFSVRTIVMTQLSRIAEVQKAHILALEAQLQAAGIPLIDLEKTQPIDDPAESADESKEEITVEEEENV